VKRIKVELDGLQSNSDEAPWRPASPDKGIVRIPQPSKPALVSPSCALSIRTSSTCCNKTREAEGRLQEMRQLIGQRQVECTPRSRMPDSYTSQVEAVTRSLEGLLSEACLDLEKTASTHEALQTDLQHLASNLKEVCFISCL
jgi:hypothetical protein